jgi:hypothetical protein
MTDVTFPSIAATSNNETTMLTKPAPSTRPCSKSAEPKSDTIKQPIEKRKIADLKSHPRQTELFTDLSQDELQALADDMRMYGLQHPVEITPDGTIICGHQRVRAAKLLGWEEINVIVRHDLAAKGAAAVEERLITDNALRRQLDPLDLARCYKRLSQVMHKQELDGKRSWTDAPKWQECSTLRDSIGKMLGCSGRKLARLATILDAPLIVQRAFQAKKLRLVDAERVGRMGKEKQEKIARRINDGEDPQKVVNELIRDQPCATVALGSFHNWMQRLNKSIVPPNLQLIISTATRSGIKSLNSTIEFLVKVKQDAEKVVEECT